MGRNIFYMNILYIRFDSQFSVRIESIIEILKKLRTEPDSDFEDPN